MYFAGKNITEHPFKKYKSIRWLIYFEKKIRIDFLMRKKMK